MDIVNLRKKDVLLFDTGILTFIFIILYAWKNYIDGFSLSNILYIAVNAIYFPIIFIWKRKYFCLYHVLYAYILVATITLRRTLLHNNFTAYFIILAIAIIRPRWKISILTGYFSIATIAFIHNDQHLVNYLIHISRATYYYVIFNYFIFTHFRSKAINKNIELLDLKEEEIEILTQMAAGKKQKEIEGYSINTVTKKLLQARTRNNINTTQELLIRFLGEVIKEE